MYFIKESFVYTHEVKQSKFIAHLCPIHDYQTTLTQLKEQHPKARHFVTAFRYYNEYSQIVEHSSDDGEPKGTSGKPSLMVLQGADMIECAVVVVRYFGGTKLGTGGLVRAYSDAVNGVLESAQLFEYKKEKSINIEIEYPQLRYVEYECDIFGVNILEKLFDEKITFSLRAEEQNMDDFLEKVQRAIKVL